MKDWLARKYKTATDQMLHPGETIVDQAEIVSGMHIGFITLTDARVIVVTSPAATTFRVRTRSLETRLENILEVHFLPGSLMAGDKNTMTVTSRTGDWSLRFVHREGQNWPHKILDQQAIAQRLLGEPARAADPAPEKFHRSISLDREQPPGTERLGGDETVGTVAQWMRNEFDAGNYRSVWSRRLSLGYELVKGDADHDSWFWANALPAMAGLRIGLKDHPFVPVCAGYADQEHSPGTTSEDDAMREIQASFFGSR